MSGLRYMYLCCPHSQLHHLSILMYFRINCTFMATLLKSGLRYIYLCMWVISCYVCPVSLFSRNDPVPSVLCNPLFPNPSPSHKRQSWDGHPPKSELSSYSFWGQHFVSYQCPWTQSIGSWGLRKWKQKPKMQLQDFQVPAVTMP